MYGKKQAKEKIAFRRPALTPRNAARAKKRPVGRSVVCIIALKLPPGRPSCVKRYASFLERVLCVCALVCVYFIAYASTHLRASTVAVQRRPGVWIALFFLFICRQLRSSFHPASLDLGSRQITLNVDLWGFRVVYSGPSSLAHGSVRPGPARDRLSIVNGPCQSARFSS